MTRTLGHGISHTRGRTHLLRYELALPCPVDRVWAAVATPEGLPGWLAGADPMEPRPGGAVTLRSLDTGGPGDAAAAPGTITAWEPRRLVEYTVAVYGRLRFEVQPDATGGTLLHFTNEMTGADEERLARLAGWHTHFEYLYDVVCGARAERRWSSDRWRELYAEYRERR